jgi:2'-phosphotransferase
MTPDGYVPVQELIAHVHPKLKVLTSVEQIQRIVANNDKQRYSLAEKPASIYYDADKDSSSENDGDPDGNSATVLCIRANQGHSIDFIDPYQLLELLSSGELVSLPTVVHGTYYPAWDLIKTGGLNRMTRQHIHFATGLPPTSKTPDGAEINGVISGMRQTAEVRIFIDTRKCADDGIPFFRSANGVILTSGKDDCGILPTEYFSYVTDRGGTILLDNRNANTPLNAATD